MEFEGKIALVTGGASGIGKATVMELAGRGARVICADINEAAGRALAEEAGQSNLKVEYEPIDLTDSASIRRCAAAVTARHPRIDILVNAAGFSVFYPFLETPPDYLDKVIAGNLTGALHLTQALLPSIIAAGNGHIVNVASDAGRVGSTGETAYAAAKGGMIAFTKSLAREVARHGVCVNCVCPGPTDTPLLDTRSDKLKDAFVRAIAFRRLGKPQEIADAIVFFAGSKSSYVTAQVLSVSGGLTYAG
ncbi:MAG: SDR family NAD(P)-dependent oxidoreductase [Bradyrhizobium sp.]|uniref:SDR family NAD(P)-dependent oxidoreductase n=1 Tax=Bradyrhizobium sp. TaxID=376 RepID=UPI003D13EE22